ncbi:MAG: M56 family metallopeptidase, partial [Candidatus Bipolaricaulaceae bacterium]
MRLPTFPAGLWALAPSVLMVGGALVGLVRLGVGVVRLRRIKGASVPWAHPAWERAQRWAGPGRTAEPRLCPRVSTPTVVGWRRPVILLPPYLISRLREEELALVLLHELGHVRRRDDWLGLAQELLRALFFFQPAVWFLGRELAVARELACDAWAAARLGGEGSYLRALLRAGEVLWRWAPVQAARLGFSGPGLQRRVQMLRSGKWREPRQRRLWRLGLAALTLGGGVGLLFLPTAVVLEAQASRAWTEWRQVPGWPTEPGTFAVLSGQAFIPAALAFSPRGDLLAVAEHGSRVVRVWNLSFGREVLTLVPPPAPSFHMEGWKDGLAFSPDGRLLAALDFRDDRTYLNLWDLERRELLLAIPAGTAVAGMQFSPDGRYLAWIESPLAPIFMEKEERVLRILDLKTGQTSRLEVENPVDFAFSPNNQWLAVL